MGEHLKNMVVGLVAMHVVVAALVTVVWLCVNHGNLIALTVLFCGLCGACYGLGYSLRQKWKRPTPEGER